MHLDVVGVVCIRAGGKGRKVEIPEGSSSIRKRTRERGKEDEKENFKGKAGCWHKESSGQTGTEED
jgi:hypothetical protein